MEEGWPAVWRLDLETPFLREVNLPSAWLIIKCGLSLINNMGNSFPVLKARSLSCPVPSEA